jgi:DNA-directed RNA polymerase specialized sigma24 family protein
MAMTSALTREAFERLEALLESDPSRAGQEYEHVRRVLIDFFRWRRCTRPEELADEVFDRVARQLERGRDIHHARAYFYEVARRVYLEESQSPERRLVPLESVPVLPDPQNDPLSVIERAGAERDLARRLAHVHRCLAALPPESRRLFLRYHRGTGRLRTDRRRRLAEELDLSMNALRIRVCRIAEEVSACVETGLEGAPLP